MLETTPRSAKIQTFCRIKPALSPKQNTCTFVQTIAPGVSHSSSEQDTLPNTLRIALPSSYVHTTHNLDSDPVFEFPDGNGLLSNDQEEIFLRTALPAIEQGFEGYNSCIFAYGQTGSGKTYTMTGGGTYAERGIIPRVLSEVFGRVKEQHCKIYVSYLEIYNENAYDILDKSKGSKTLEQWGKVTVQDDADGEAQLNNLRVYECISEEQALSLLFLGNSNRITSATKMNMASSRSHAIFTLSISCTSEVRKFGRAFIREVAHSTHTHTHTHTRTYKNTHTNRIKSRLEKYTL